jgi:hypothetical protein
VPRAPCSCQGDPREHSTWLAARPRCFEKNAVRALIAALRASAANTTRPGFRIHVVHLAGAAAARRQPLAPPAACAAGQPTPFTRKPAGLFRVQRCAPWLCPRLRRMLCRRRRRPAARDCCGQGGGPAPQRGDLPPLPQLCHRARVHRGHQVCVRVCVCVQHGRIAASHPPASVRRWRPPSAHPFALSLPPPPMPTECPSPCRRPGAG